MPNSNLDHDDRRLAFRMADMFLLHPPDRIALILADVLRMAVERWQARDRRLKEDKQR